MQLQRPPCSIQFPLCAHFILLTDATWFWLQFVQNAECVNSTHTHTAKQLTAWSTYLRGQSKSWKAKSKSYRLRSGVNMARKSMINREARNNNTLSLLWITVRWLKFIHSNQLQRGKSIKICDSGMNSVWERKRWVILRTRCNLCPICVTMTYYLTPIAT